jgi:hypothetical protein
MSGIHCYTKPCSMYILRPGTCPCLFPLQQYSRDTFHRLHASVAFGVRSLLSVSGTAGMCKPWWPFATFDDFGHCHYDREDTDWPSEPQLVSNSISSVH